MEWARRRSIAVLVLLFLTLAGYADSFPGSFIWDDTPLIVDNPLVSSADLRLIFTTDYCGQSANCGTYRPLTTLSYALNRRLIGAGAASFHAVNVALHAAVTLLLFFFLEAAGFGWGVSLLAATLFGVHPMHTEVVNLATNRAESLAALGVLLALWAALRRRRGHVLLALVAFACALLSKETGLVFLLLLPLVDGFRSADLRQTFRERRLLYAAALTLTAGWFLIRHLVARGAAVPPDLISATDNPLVGLELPPRILTALKAQLFYIGKLLLPVRLQAVYTGSSIGVVTSPFSPWGLAGVTATSLALAVAVHGWLKRSAFGFGVLFYAASFAITANFVFTMPVLLGERLAYLPSAGFCLALASLMAAAARSVPPRWPRAGVQVLCGIYLLLLGGLLARRNRDFSSELSLAQAAVRLDPGNARAWYYLGGAREKGGDDSQAEQALRTGIAVDSGFPDTYGQLAQLLNRRGRFAEGREVALQAIRLFPGEFPQAQLALAKATLELGSPVEARAWIERVAPGPHRNETYWDLRAQIMQSAGDLPGAVEARRRGFAQQEDADAGLRLAELLIRVGGLEEAAPILQRLASRLRRQLHDSETPELLNQYGLSLALQQHYTEAVPAFRKAVSLDPASAVYRSNYEHALQAAGASAAPPD